MKLYTIRDAITEKFFGRIFMFENDQHAMRVFVHGLQNPDDPMSQHPDDYTLYRIGAYNDDAGIPIGHDPVRIATGVEILNIYKDRLAKVEALQAEIHNIQKGNADIPEELNPNIDPQELDNAE
jgi:hypothetical protein